jgi:hypothetical protein
VVVVEVLGGDDTIEVLVSETPEVVLVVVVVLNDGGAAIVVGVVL